jgi:outer membrane murein-binding lipoprotein Lpp
MRLYLPLGLILLLAGCESNEAKIDRLKQEEAAASLVAWHRGKLSDSVASSAAPDSVKAAFRDTARQAENERDLAQRNLNRFMSR